MGDHFVLLVDRLLTESTLDVTIGSGNQIQIGGANGNLQNGAETSVDERDCCDSLSCGKMVECRICHDEDEDCNMESPCSCCGSLKYAHRKCVQRWCNEKGDTICEICLQHFRPGYTAPPQLFQYGSAPMNFRGNWEISRQDLNDSRFITMVATDRGYTDNLYDDYGHSTTRNILYCRSVAIVFTALLILRHVLPIIVSGDEYSFTMFTVSLLRIVGILVPVYVMVRVLSVFRHRRRQPSAPYQSNDVEIRTATHLQPQMHSIHVYRESFN